MEKLRILILNASGIYGGGEYYTYQLAINLLKKGHFITVGCIKENLLYKKCIENSIYAEHINFGKNGSNGLIGNIKRIKRIAKEKNIDIIHTNTGIDRTAGAIAAKLAGIKHVTSCHSLVSVQRNLTHYIRNKKLTHAFIADGENVRKLLAEKDKIDPVKIYVINNGVEPGEMGRDDNARKTTRESLGIKENEIAIGCTARLVYFKGHKYLINAFSVLCDKFSNVKLIITGDGELQNELTEYAQILKLSDKIIFTGFRDDLRNIYSAYDISVNPSIEGGGELFPYTVLYAMAQSMPIVATSIGDMPYMIENGVSGFIVKEKSAVELAEKLELLVNEPELRIKTGKEAYSRLIKYFTLQQTIDKTEKLYYKILHNYRRIK